MKSIALALLGLLPAAVAEVTHTGFEIRDDPRCTNGLGLEIDTLLCDDGTGATGTCDLGETAYMTGRLTIGNAGLFQRAIITSRACVFGLNWGDLTCNYYEFEADLCSVLGIYETYGECPDDGEWDVESSFNLPGFGNMHLGRGKSSPIGLPITECMRVLIIFLDRLVGCHYVGYQTSVLRRWPRVQLGHCVPMLPYRRCRGL